MRRFINRRNIRVQNRTIIGSGGNSSAKLKVALNRLSDDIHSLNLNNPVLKFKGGSKKKQYIKF